MGGRGGDEPWRRQYTLVRIKGRDGLGELLARGLRRELVDAAGGGGGVVGALLVLADVPLLEVDPVGADPGDVSSRAVL